MLGKGDRQDPRPALGDQPREPPGVLLGPESADLRRDEVAPVSLKAHRTGGEADPAAVTAADLEAREPDPPSPAAAAVLGIGQLCKAATRSAIPQA